MRGMHVSDYGIDIETHVVESPNEEDVIDYMIYVSRQGGWIITEEVTGNIVERYSDRVDRMTRWRFLAWILVERSRAWPRLERLQFQIRAQMQQGQPVLSREEIGVSIVLKRTKTSYGTMEKSSAAIPHKRPLKMEVDVLQKTSTPTQPVKLLKHKKMSQLQQCRSMKELEVRELEDSTALICPRL